MATRIPMVLLGSLITTLVLGVDTASGAESMPSRQQWTDPEGVALPWSFGGEWEMDLRCTDGDGGKRRTGSGTSPPDGVGTLTGRTVQPSHEHGLPPRRGRNGARPAAVPNEVDDGVDGEGATRGSMASGHHSRSIDAGTRFVVEPGPWASDDGIRVLLRASGEDSDLDAGWTRSDLRIAGSVALREEIPCAATADEVITMIQQQDLLRIEGNACLDAGTSHCHDHFVVIISRRRGTLGSDDQGQLVVFAMDAGGQYTTGHRIRSLVDAAAYGGPMKRHLGGSHSHEVGGGD